MSCLPNTPISDNILSATNSTDSGWIDISVLNTATALSQYYPLSDSVTQLSNMAQTTSQHINILQVEIEETATSSANIQTVPTKMLLFNGTVPPTPTLGAVYNPVNANIAAIIDIPDTAFTRLSDTVWRASINANYWTRTNTTTSSNFFYAVLLHNSATPVTYPAGSSIRIRVMTKMATAL